MYLHQTVDWFRFAADNGSLVAAVKGVAAAASRKFFARDKTAENVGGISRENSSSSRGIVWFEKSDASAIVRLYSR